MKKMFSSFLRRTGSVVMAAAILGSGAAVMMPVISESSITAEAASSGDFSYFDTTGGVFVWYTGKNSTVNFPSSIGGKKVVKIDLSFNYPEVVKTVNIPASVTKIDFFNYSKNNALTAVNVDSKNTKYTSVNGIVFNKNKDTLIYYPKYKTGTSYTIPSYVKKIDYCAFSNLYLEKVTVPKSVTSISFDAFEYTSSLKEIKVDSANTVYKDSNGILYSKNMDTLECYPQAKPASEFTVPQSVVWIRVFSFENASKLQKVNVGAQTSIMSFPGTMSALKEINVSSSNKYYKTVGGVLFDKNMSNLYLYPAAKTGDVYKVPDSVKTISSGTFENNKNLTGISMSKNLEKFYFGTLSSMNRIKEVAFFNSKTKFDDYYFTSKDKLKNIVVHGYNGSTAQTYAKNNSLKFQSITGTTATGITINKTALSAGVNESVQLSAVVKPFYATNKAVTWSSSKTNIATVSSGKITAKAVGSAVVTVKTNNGKTAKCNVTVKQAPKSVTLTKGVLTLGVGESFTLGSGVNNGAASAKRTYRTSNSSIVKMTNTEWTGVFKGVKPGVAYVTVRTYNGKESTCKVTVKQAPAWVKMAKSDVTMKVGQKMSVGAIIPDGSGCATRTYKLSSYNNGVVKLTKSNWNAEFVAQKAGYTSVTVQTYNGKTATCYITVKK